MFLDAFKEFPQDTVFLDIPDPVHSTLHEIQFYLERDYHEILIISCHGSAGDGGGSLRLENDHGNGIDVSATEFAEFLCAVQKTSGNPVKVVILSACHTAAEEFDLDAFVTALESTGVEAIIGMNGAITLVAALRSTTVL